MSTITLKGLKLTRDFLAVTSVSATEARVTVGSASDTFTYSITEDSKLDLPTVDITDTILQAILDGNLLSDLQAAGTLDAGLGTVTWSGGTTTVLAVSWETGPDSDIDLIFVLDGAPLPAFATPAEWNAFEASITLIGQATGSFAPGQPILWTEFDGSTVTEDDEFFGTAGRDTYPGGAGDDYFHSSNGKDVYNGGKGFDQVSFRGDPSGVTANLSTGVATDGWGKRDTLKNIEMLRGSMFGDKLIGDGARNHIRGLAGDDTLNGRGGDDLVRYDRDAHYGGTAGVTVNLKKGKATDGFGDTDTLRNFSDVYGSDSNDKLIGDAGDNDLSGLAGDDRLSGLAGYDVIDGGDGNDTLSGGGRADTFVFSGSFGNDLITDFNTAGNREKIDLSGVGAIKSYKDLINNHLSDVVGQAVIDDGAGNTITLAGLTSADLGQNDFLF